MRPPLSAAPDLRSTVVSPQAAAAAAELSRGLGRPVALLSRDGHGWQFEAESFPPAFAMAERGVHPPAPISSTGIALGRRDDREWLALVADGTASARERTVDELAVIERARAVLDVETSPPRPRARVGLSFEARLYALTRRVARETDHGKLHRRILAALTREAAAKTGCFATYHEAERILAITATHGYPLPLVEALRIRPGDGILGSAFVTGRAVIGSAAAHGTRRLRYESDSFVVLPFSAGAQRLGVAAFTDRVGGQPFTDADVARLRLMAAPAAVALARARTVQGLDELAKQVAIDPLTGLFNRRHFDVRLSIEMQRARRQGLDIALLIGDIDDFKQINDRRGHLEGDRALREVAQLLREATRVFDVCARFGGEEFVILMPGASAHVAGRAAERIRQYVERHGRSVGLPLTMSVGVGRPGRGFSGEGLLVSADRALMAAKASGKNVVWIDGADGRPCRFV